KAASVPDQSTLAAMSPQERRESFFHQPLPKRAAIVAAGPIANFILAVLIYASVLMTFGEQITSARVDSVQPDTAAAAARFQRGDLVVGIDGQPIRSFDEMKLIVAASAGSELQITVDRGGVETKLKATPTLREVKDRFGNVHRIGVLGISRSTADGETRTERVSAGRAVVMGVEKTWFIIDRTMSYLAGVVIGRESADQLGGPIRIA